MNPLRFNPLRFKQGTLVTAAISFALASLAPAAKGPSAEQLEFFLADEMTPDLAMAGRQFYIPSVFGPTGLTGWLSADGLVVREVDNGSPADGVALPNDVIIAVNGVPLEKRLPFKTLGEQVEVSEQSGKMTLLVKRGGKKETLNLKIRKLGAFGEDWPFDCAKSRQIHLDACEFMARNQLTDGMFDGRIYVGFAFNGLTWLASEDPQYLENCRRLAYGYRDHFDPTETSTINWEWAYMAVYLVEYYLQTGDDSVKPLAADVGRALARSQLPCGTWGHGPFPGAGYVQGGALNNCGLVCWMALALLDEAGIDVDQKALAKSTKFFKRFTYNGGVPYGDHRPEFGGGNGKNALPGVTLNILGDQAGSEYYARLVTGSYKGRTGGHTGGFMGFVWGNVQGAQNPHHVDYQRMLNHWKWLQNASRRWDGGFLLPESIIGKIYTFRGPALATGGMAQMYAMPNRVLRVHGGPKSVFAKQELPEPLAKGVELYKEREFDELRQLVQPKDRLSRQLLAAADRWEQDIALSIERIDRVAIQGDTVRAQRMVNDMRQRNNNARGMGMGKALSSHKDKEHISNARKLYEANKWLTYSNPEARAVFEKLAADDQAGIYQVLARRELATPDDAAYWTYLCELIFIEGETDWKIDPKAKALLTRAASIRSANWPMCKAINILQEEGILAEQLKDWTPILVPPIEGYPGTPTPCKYTYVTAGKIADGWKNVEFDDSGWETGAKPDGRGRPYVRIPFELDRNDYKSLRVGVETAGKIAMYLNGEPVLWSDATRGGRMRMDGLLMVELPQNSVKKLRKGKNVLAYTTMGSARIGVYASLKEPKIGFKPRPKDWLPGLAMAEPVLKTRNPKWIKVHSLTEPSTTGLKFDEPGKLNYTLEQAAVEFKRTEENPQLRVPLAERVKYFGHFDSRVRRLAGFSVRDDGEKAVPHIIEALQSKDKRVVRAACDALAGNFSMNGLGRGSHKILTHELCGQTVPYLLPLVKHEDMYVRQGALMALSQCGPAVAPHLKEIVKASDDEDWLVRAGVAYVLGNVDDPRVGEVVESIVENYLTEQSIYGTNRFREAVSAMARHGHGADAIVGLLVKAAKGSDPSQASRAMSVLPQIGSNARAALPLFEEKLADARKRLKETSDPGSRRWIEREISKWEGAIEKAKAEPSPPRQKR